MNKLDNLLSIVDNLELKSNALLQGCQQSNTLLDQILNNNNHISTFDIKIDNTNQLLQNNYQFTAEFNELVSKTCLFEHNFLNNDTISNSNTFSNLNHEFEYLKLKFGIDTNVPDYQETRPLVSTKPSNVNLPKLNSISDLSLKPLRCKSNKVYKKKSHYRISNIFNNPILNSPVTPNPEDPNIPNESHTDDLEDSLDNIMDQTYPQSNDTTPDMEYTNFDINEKPYIHELLPNTIDCDLNDNDSVLSDTLDSPEFNFEQYLRKSRINLNKDSYPYVVRKSVSDASLNLDHSIDPLDDSPRYTDLSSSSLETNVQVPKTLFNFKYHNPIDNVKPSHDFISPTIQSIHSTTMASSPRSDLSNTLTEKLCSDVYSSCNYNSNPSWDHDTHTQRSGSVSGVFGADSFLSKVMNVSASPQSMKSKSESNLNPTNHIASTVTQTPTSAARTSSSTQSSTKSSSSHQKEPFSFFKFIGSPDKSRAKPQSQQSQQPRQTQPITGRSLTEGFFQLMQAELSNPLPPKLNSTPILTQSKLESNDDSDHPINFRRKRRNKLSELKSIPKSTPILIQTHNHYQRLPPNTNNGSSSSLTLSSNKSFKVSHGESSHFKKPIVQHFSSRSLQEALTSSMLY